MQAIGLVLAARLLLFIAVGIDAALGFMVGDVWSGAVFAVWTAVVIPLLVWLDITARKPPGG